MGKKTNKAEKKLKNAKAAEEQKQIQQHQQDLIADAHEYPKRPLLEIPRDSFCCNGNASCTNGNLPEGERNSQYTYKGLPLSIMTFNMLAQSLIQRKLFPTSGEILRWNIRRNYLTTELFYYNADILFLQEVDIAQFDKFWRPVFKEHEYECEFVYASMKQHGVAIAWKTAVFDSAPLAKQLVKFDEQLTEGVEKVTSTGNIGLILKLRFTENYKNAHAPTSKTSSVCIGTTHLFWHPFGTFERTRQTYIMLKEMRDFALKTKDSHLDGEKIPPTFFCGDFNSQPFDTPYLSITSKPVKYNDDHRMQTVLNCSLTYNYKEEKNKEYDNPKTPVPDQISLNPEHQELCLKLQNLHNNLDCAAVSLYSCGYKYVHPENSGLDNDKNEPELSNWAHTWRGLLDYILLVKPWDLNKDITKTQTLEEFENENSLKIKSFLRMPPASELPDHCLPHPNEYGSDHLSMMCEMFLQ